MARINQLPPEVLAIVLRNLDDAGDLIPIFLAHSCFSRAFYEYYPNTRIDKIILRRQIDPRLLPLAIANVEASHRTYPDRDILDVREAYVDIMFTPSTFIERFNKPDVIPTSDMIRMGRIHNCIGTAVQGYSSAAWREITGSGAAVKLSDSETLRFYRAFYHLELFFSLCKGEIGMWDSYPQTRSAAAFSMYPPWEWEQLSCVYRYLKSQAADASKPLFSSRSYNQVRSS